MKIQRSELKAIVKECLKELIAEGALNNVISEAMQTQQMPMMNYGYPQQMSIMPNSMGVSGKVKTVAGSIAKTSEEAKLYETIFSDAEMTMRQQDGSDVDPQNVIRNMQMQAPTQDYYFQQQPQYNQGYMPPPQQYQQPYQQPVPQQPQFMHNIRGQQPQRGNQSQGSRWASLAFNSPIKNRPDASGGSVGSLGGGPGTNMGKFD